jgi:hypothetical protein
MERGYPQGQNGHQKGHDQNVLLECSYSHVLVIESWKAELEEPLTLEKEGGSSDKRNC